MSLGLAATPALLSSDTHFAPQIRFGDFVPGPASGPSTRDLSPPMGRMLVHQHIHPCWACYPLLHPLPCTHTCTHTHTQHPRAHTHTRTRMHAYTYAHSHTILED